MRERTGPGLPGDTPPSRLLGHPRFEPEPSGCRGALTSQQRQPHQAGVSRTESYAGYHIKPQTSPRKPQGTPPDAGFPAPLSPADFPPRLSTAESHAPSAARGGQALAEPILSWRSLRTLSPCRSQAPSPTPRFLSDRLPQNTKQPQPRSSTHAHASRTSRAANPSPPHPLPSLSGHHRQRRKAEPTSEATSPSVPLPRGP